jgi:single-stranded-DNA-specific exonuclease
MSKDWIIAQTDPRCEGLASQLGVTPMVASVLLNRGLDDPAAARQFMRPQLKDLLAPETLPGVTEAAEHIAAAVRNRHKIVIYGDYDVDGITGTAILWRCLRLAGADVDFYVPHRLEEGYGINGEALRRLAETGTKLVVSVDCGITAKAAAAVAAEVGLELIVTDHHTIDPDNVPDATVLVHPGLDGETAQRDLSGAGVAFKLAWALAQTFCNATRVTNEYRTCLLDAVSLAALGTIADVVPLTGENRIITHYGLSVLKTSALPGVAALIDSAGLGKDTVTSTHVGFNLAPRLNAAGRMGHARLAVELLTRADDARAREIAIYLAEQNRQRQSVERKTRKHACELVAAGKLTSDANRGLVVAAEGWHAGVIGIVASRLVDEFSRPTVMLAIDGDTAQGSARGIRHFNMHEALMQCSEHLETYGGHAMAAGLKLKTENIEAFTRSFVEHANQTLTAADLRPKLRLDGQVALAEVTEPVVTALGQLEPFGVGNPKPRFATDWVELVGEPRVVGKSGDHLQFSVREDGTVRKAIAFGQAKHLDRLGDERRCRVAFIPILNHFNGRTSVELEVVDFKFPGDDEAA